ncbi:MAG: hypothetical protein OJF49_004199 [Ktedonobacterales bacterium]|nr:MAG: hypothetical protein OJF49_004199 [Ktedonobacterales bacterium]
MTIHPWDLILGGIFAAQAIIWWLLPISGNKQPLSSTELQQFVARFLYPPVVILCLVGSFIPMRSDPFPDQATHLLFLVALLLSSAFATGLVLWRLKRRRVTVA